MNHPDPSGEQALQFSVVKGNPTDEELAALFVILTTRTPDPSGSPPLTSSSGWSAYWRSVRRPLHPGPGVWRMSGRA